SSVIADFSNLLSSFNLLTGIYFDLVRIHMGIKGIQSTTMMNYNYTTITLRRSRPDHDSVSCRKNGSSNSPPYVNPFMKSAPTGSHFRGNDHICYRKPQLAIPQETTKIIIVRKTL